MGASTATAASSKRQRVDQAPDSDTASEEDEGSGRLVRLAAERLLCGLPGASTNHRPGPARPSAPGTHPPPPSLDTVPLSRQSTATTVPATQPSRSQYGKSTTPTSPLPPIPTLLSPPRGPVHARLRRKALQRYLDRADQDAAGLQATTTDEEVDQLAPTDNEAAHEFRHGVPQEPRAGPSASGSAPRYTYNSVRTHAASQPQAGPSERRREHEREREREPESEPESVPEAGPGPNDPDLTPAMLLLMERERAMAAKAHAELEGQLNRRHRALLFTEATEPPRHSSSTPSATTIDP